MDFYDIQKPVEVVPGLILGSLRALRDILRMEPDVLFPLDRLPGWVWEEGFRGEVVYYPITDYEALPGDVLEKLVNAVLERLRAGKRVALFCVGGRGRTGYAAACVRDRLGKENPIAFLRQHYSPKAVESEEQERGIERFQLRHVAETYWGCQQRLWKVWVRDPQAVWDDPGVCETVRRIQEELGERARMLLRRSGVVPEIRVLVEAPEVEQCEKAFETFRRVLEERGHLAERP